VRVLLVEDNRSLADWTAKALRHAGMVVDCMSDGIDADHVLATQTYDIVLLDLTLPRMDGITVLRNLRARGSHVPVLVLTVKSHIEDRVQGLDAGADDYLGKPYALSELEARIRALARRSQGAVSNETTVASLTYESAGRHFCVAGNALELTPRERGVLELLITRAGTPVSKQLLSDRIVGLDTSVSIEAIEVYIHRLRKKLEGSGAEIRTLRGLGYMLEARNA
jgi:two-component system, OmpR family, response regulator TctD